MLAAASAEEAAAAAALGVRRVGAVEDLRCLDEDLDRCGAWCRVSWPFVGLPIYAMRQGRKPSVLSWGHAAAVAYKLL